jgi:hypothetical protein
LFYYFEVIIDKGIFIFWDISSCSSLTANGLHGVISQEIELLIITALRTGRHTTVVRDYRMTDFRGMSLCEDSYHVSV